MSMIGSSSPLVALLIASGAAIAQTADLPPAEDAARGAAELTPAEPQQECRERWEAGEERGVTHGTALYEGALTVLVDEAAWNAMDRDAKIGMVETLECAFAGPEGTLMRADFRDHRTDEVLGEWRYGDLYRPGHRQPMD